MEAKFAAALQGRSRRKLSQEMLALCAWTSPDQGRVCDLSKVIGAAPAHARIGLALWLQDAAARDAARSDPEMNPERFPQRRSTRLMIPHTAGNSDRVLFSLRLPEPGVATTENAPQFSETETGKGPGLPSDGDGGEMRSANGGAYEVKVHGERRSRRANPAERVDEPASEFTGVPLPAWIMAHGSSPQSHRSEAGMIERHQEVRAAGAEVDEAH